MYFQVKVNRKIFAYTWSNFLAELGGNIGLWLGVSIVGLADNFVDTIKYLKLKKNHIMEYLYKRKAEVLSAFVV